VPLVRLADDLFAVELAVGSRPRGASRWMATGGGGALESFAGHAAAHAHLQRQSSSTGQAPGAVACGLHFSGTWWHVGHPQTAKGLLMFFRKIKTPGLAHNAYLLGDKEEAILVDPRRDLDEYLALAREEGLVIKYIVETHRQEDFVIGSRELAELTGAKIVSLDHPLFGHSDIRMADGEKLRAGSLTLQALHTPGHTPESTCYAVALEQAPERTWGVFTGDTLFIGETGRTDLADRRKTRENAGHLYDSVHRKLAPLGDQALLWPAHGAGSVCGGNIAPYDDSTMGFERATNPVFTKSREAFIEAKLRERIPRPPYFSLMEKVNLKGGLPLAKRASAVPLLPPKQFASEMKQGMVIDTREPEAFAGGHIPGSYGVWLEGLGVFGGWLANQATRVFLVLPSIDELDTALLALQRLGVDTIAGVLAGGFDAWRDAGQPIACSGTISARELAGARDRHVVLDVRDDTEFEDEGHIAGAHHLYVGYFESKLDELRAILRSGAEIAVACSVGHRAGLAASILRRRGYDRVKNVLGGMTAWNKLGLPTEKGAERSITTPDVEGERR
jgi:hydroxyacylglutathione hydrolase